jgi:hypothetical protein
MSNTNKKSLNDLFRAARDEANPELISEPDAEQLLANGTMRSLPTEQTIGQQLYGLLWTSPLKIGITTMTTATCIALGVFAFWPQTATNNSLTSQGTKTTHGAYRTHRSHETATAATPNSLLQTLIGQAPAFHKAEVLPTPAAPIATADSLHPIELSPEQLAQLGIVLEDNGDIDFYTQSKTTGEVNKFGLPPTWGVRLHLGETFSQNDLAGVRIPNFPPRLVTALNGAKRLFSFESDTSFTKMVGNRKMTVQMHNDSRFAPGADTLQNVRVEIKVFDDSSSNNARRSAMPKGTHVFINKNISTDRGAMETTRNGDTIIRKIEALDLVESDTTIQRRPSVFGNYDLSVADAEDRAKFWARDAQASNSINLDHLIPIRVRNMKNAAHPNELIFWYEPTPEVTAAVPDESVSTTPQSKKLAISVYPNPTNGPATIHFDLAGAPKAYFSVRNLLGQKVMDGGTTSGLSGDMKLDLSSLDAGVYLLVTTTDNGERDVERVVVAK